MYNSKKNNNILLTMCRDNICRLWAQSNDENNNYKFYMCKMIEPFCLPPSLNHTPASEPKISYVHWIDNREFIKLFILTVLLKTVNSKRNGFKNQMKTIN